ncbi:MAG: hypothetical protein Q8S13_02760, partial [Dehalococcoidia bacterium]|nr:hypothetical protein [Dehalococcoidia bacterium]
MAGRAAGLRGNMGAMRGRWAKTWLGQAQERAVREGKPEGYVATLANPKPGTKWPLVHVIAHRETRFRILDPSDHAVLGSSYTEDENGPFVRIHTPDGVRETKQGLGLMLYGGTAVGVAKMVGDDGEELEGVWSRVGNRSNSAGAFWNKAVKKQLAFREEGEENCDTNEIEYCTNVEDDDYDSGDDGKRTRIPEQEMCGNVNAEVCENENIDYLRA